MERVQEMAGQSGLRFVTNPSGGNALAATIRSAVAEVDPAQGQISFCGPRGLLKRVQDLMKENNIPPNNIHYEFFEFR